MCLSRRPFFHSIKSVLSLGKKATSLGKTGKKEDWPVTAQLRPLSSFALHLWTPFLPSFFPPLLFIHWTSVNWILLFFSFFAFLFFSFLRAQYESVGSWLRNNYVDIHLQLGFDLSPIKKRPVLTASQIDTCPSTPLSLFTHLPLLPLLLSSPATPIFRAASQKTTNLSSSTHTVLYPAHWMTNCNNKQRAPGFLLHLHTPFLSNYLSHTFVIFLFPRGIGFPDYKTNNIPSPAIPQKNESLQPPTSDFTFKRNNHEIEK